jgi:hypothetical protein
MCDGRTRSLLDRRRTLVVALICVLTLPGAARADFRFDNKTSTVHITGTIWDRDAGRLQTLIEKTARGPRQFSLGSDGGDMLAAMRIGRLVRKLNAHTLVAARAKCHSACALIFIAGVERKNLGEIGLHRPYLDTDADQLQHHLPMLYSRVKDYVAEMGLDDSFYQKMMDTDSSTMAIYGPSETPALIPVAAVRK